MAKHTYNHIKEDGGSNGSASPDSYDRNHTTLTIMGIFNSNDYRRGHKNGSRDAKKGKDMTFNGAGKSAKFWIHGKKALDTYCDGYKEGYRTASNRKNR